MTETPALAFGYISKPVPTDKHWKFFEGETRAGIVLDYQEFLFNSQGSFGSYLIIARFYSYLSDFKVIKVGGYEQNPETREFDVPIFGDFSDGITYNPIEVQIFLECSIKWDGCSNWDFKTNECMMHLCSKRGLAGFTILLARLYELAEQYIPRWDKECAE